jgi:hypothetical protein
VAGRRRPYRGGDLGRGRRVQVCSQRNTRAIDQTIPFMPSPRWALPTLVLFYRDETATGKTLIPVRGYAEPPNRSRAESATVRPLQLSRRVS